MAHKLMVDVFAMFFLFMCVLQDRFVFWSIECGCGDVSSGDTFACVYILVDDVEGGSVYYISPSGHIFEGSLLAFRMFGDSLYLKFWICEVEVENRLIDVDEGTVEKPDTCESRFRLIHTLKCINERCVLLSVSLGIQDTVRCEIGFKEAPRE